MNRRVQGVLEFDKIRARVVAQCATPYGRARAEEMEPLASLEDVRRAIALTAEGATVYRLRGAPPFPAAGDVRPAIQKAAVGGVCGPEELFAIALTAQRARAIQRFLLAAAESSPLPEFLSLADLLPVDRVFDEEIFRCVSEEGIVLDAADPGLAEVRRSLANALQRMKRTLEEMIRSPQVVRFLQDTIVTVRGDRYCLAVKSEHRQQVPGVIHDESASGSTVFVEPERVLRIANEARRLRAEEEREVERVLIRLSASVAAVADRLAEAVDGIGRVDFALAKARYAHLERSVEPVIKTEPALVIRGGRHPLLDLENAIPIDVEIGRSFRALVVTGPNTGGKTVTLKTMGLLTVMAMSGLFVPAREGTEVGFFREVFADIGDEQSIEQNLSTFSSHMTHIVQILQDADERSLVLFDELGAGTDPTEGSALAMAILDELRARRVATAATTHYSELKSYAYTEPETMNASMEFDIETLGPTYRLLMGVPGRSNAFAIAHRLGLDARLIDRAKGKLSASDVRVEDLISRLQQSVVTAEKEESRLREARERAEIQAETLERARMQFDAEERARRKRAEEEARAYVQRVSREASDILQELREFRAAGVQFKDHELQAMKSRLEHLSPAPTLEAVPKRQRAYVVQVGDEVRVLPLGGQKGTVIEWPGGSADLLVAVGAMKMKVKRSDVELLRRADKTAAPAAQFTRTTEHVRPDLDLRGATIEEAMAAIDRYLDRAILAGYRQVTLIHGKGTGALRAGVQQYVRAHPSVRSARLGGEGEGGGGVTVVELR